MRTNPSSTTLESGQKPKKGSPGRIKKLSQRDLPPFKLKTIDELVVATSKNKESY